MWSEQGMPFIPQRLEKAFFFTLMGMCGNHNKAPISCGLLGGLRAVSQMIINACWHMYTLPAWAVQVNSALCVCV